MKLFEVIIEGSENGDHFSVMYHVQAQSVKQVPRIIKETAHSGHFQLIRIEETHFLHEVENDLTGVVNIIGRSIAPAE